jgi:uncharacterized membrane protein
MDERLIRQLMASICFAISLLVVLTGFGISMTIFLGHHDHNVILGGAVVATTLVVAAFIAALGGLMSWREFIAVTHAVSKEKV